MLFLDRRVPDLDTEELIAIIQRRFPGIQVVLLDSDDAALASGDAENEAEKAERSEVRPFASAAPQAAAHGCLWKTSDGESEPLPGMIELRGIFQSGKKKKLLNHGIQFRRFILEPLKLGIERRSGLPSRQRQCQIQSRQWRPKLMGDLHQKDETELLDPTRSLEVDTHHAGNIVDADEPVLPTEYVDCIFGQLQELPEVLGHSGRTHELSRQLSPARDVVHHGRFEKRQCLVDVAFEVAREEGLNQCQSVIGHGVPLPQGWVGVCIYLTTR